MGRADVFVSTRVFAAIVAAGRAAGVRMEPLLARLGIDERDLAEVDGRLPLTVEDALWDATAAASGDPCFPLHAASAAPEHEWDVFGYALRTSPTLYDALENAARYNRLLHDVAVLALEPRGARVAVTHRFVADPAGASVHAADFTIASIVGVARALTGARVRPESVTLAHPAPKDDAPYRALFECPVSFGGAHNEIVFHRDVLARPVVSGDPALHAILRRHADELLARLPRRDDLATRAREAITAALRGGDPSLEDVARALGTSGRTLQRRLGEGGLRYQDLVDELRRELAFAYLRDARMGVGEVAYLLGFSEPRAFHRAFKRWTGTTPAAWRAAQA